MDFLQANLFEEDLTGFNIQRKRLNNSNYVAPDMYLNTAITQGKIDKMVNLYNNEGYYTKSDCFIGFLIDEDGNEQRVNIRDKQILDDISYFKEQMMNLGTYRKVKGYNSKFLKRMLQLRYMADEVETIKHSLGISLTLSQEVFRSMNIPASMEQDRFISDFISKYKDLIVSQELWRDINLLQCSMIMEHGITNYFIKRGWSSNEGICILSSTTFKIWMTSRAIIVNLKNDLIYIMMSREQILKISDLTSERMFVYLANEMASQLQIPGYPESSLIDEIFKWGDSLLSYLGNDGYTIIANLEAMCTWRLLTMNKANEVFDHETFLTDLVNGVDPRNREYIHSFINLLNSIDDPRHVSQVFGLYRLWGHPNVDVSEGLLKIKTLGSQQKKCDLNYIKRGSLMFRYLFIRGFTEKEGKWPNCRTTTNLTKLKDYNIVPSLGINCELQDFSELYLLKNFEVDDSANLSALISDKSISLDKPSLIQAIKKNGGIGTSENRRVILEMIKRNTPQSKTILDDIDKNGLKPKNKVIGALEKERELKVKPRMFAMLTFDHRIYFVATEDMISKDLLPLFPQTTKTYSYLEMRRSMISWSQNLINPLKRGKLSVIINIDFEKWNTNMRAVIVNPIFRDMDRLWGYSNLISRTHEMFSSSTIYSASSDAQLLISGKDFVENEWAWSGHLGGLEGLRQGGWTVVTICYLYDFCYSEGLSFNLIGQGDNQVLRLSVPLTEEEESDYRHGSGNLAKAKIKRIKMSLCDYMSKVGLPIKQAETWESCSLFAYSKNLFLNGVQLPMDLKRISRMYGFINSSYLGLENILGNIFASGTASAEFAPLALIPYIMSLFSGALEINRGLSHHAMLNTSIHGLLSDMNARVSWGSTRNLKKDNLFSISKSSIYRAINQIDKTLFFLLLRPKCLGGYSIQLYPSFTTRGFPDIVSMSISFLRNLYQSSRDKNIKEAIRTILNIRQSPVINPLLLFENPESINPLSPSSGDAFIKSITEEILKDMLDSNTSWFNTLIKSATKDNLELANKLFTVTPINALFLADVLDASVTAHCRHLISQVNKSTTVRRIAIAFGSEDLRLKFHKMEIVMILFQLESSTLNPIKVNDQLLVCPLTPQLESLRERGWGKRVKDITVPFFLDLLHPMTRESNCHHCASLDKETNGFQDPESDYVIVRVSDYIVKDPLLLNTTCEEFEPYIGSTTKEKTSNWSKNLSIQSNLPLLKKCINLMRLIGWTIEENSPASRLIHRLVKSITDLPIETLFAMKESVKGSAAHRQKSTRLSREGIYAGLSSPLTHLSVSSNRVKTYARGMENVMLHFQGLFIFCLEQVVNSLTLRPEHKDSCFHFHLKTKRELSVIDEDTLTGDPNWDKIDFPRGVYPYTYYRKEDIMYKHTNIHNCMKNISQEIKNPQLKASIEHWIGLRLSVCLARSQKVSQLNPWESVPNISISLASRLELSKILTSTIDWLYVRLMRDYFIWKKCWLTDISEIRKRLLTLLQDAEIQDFNALGLFYGTSDLAEYTITTNNVYPNSYPYTREGCLRCIKEILIKELNNWRLEDFHNRMNDVVLIMNDIKYWDYEARYMLISFCVGWSHLYPSLETENVMRILTNWSSYPIYPVFVQSFIRLYQLSERWKNSMTSALRGTFEALADPLPLCTSLSKSQNNQESMKPISETTGHVLEVSDSYLGSELTSLVYDYESMIKPCLAKIYDENQYDLSLDLLLAEPRCGTKGAYKLFEPSKQSSITGSISSCVVLGDGLGSTSGYLSHLLRSGSIILPLNYISFDRKDFRFIESSVQPESLKIKKRGIRILDGSTTSGDVTSQTCIKAINSFYNRNQEKKRALVSDVEGAVWSTDEHLIYKNLYEIIRQNDIDFGIIKFYLSDSYNIINLFALMAKKYKTLKVVRSHFSSPQVPEFYFLFQDKNELELNVYKYCDCINLNQQSFLKELTNCILKNNQITTSIMLTLSAAKLKLFQMRSSVEDYIAGLLETPCSELLAKDPRILLEAWIYRYYHGEADNRIKRRVLSDMMAVVAIRSILPCKSLKERIKRLIKIQHSWAYNYYEDGSLVCDMKTAKMKYKVIPRSKGFSKRPSLRAIFSSIYIDGNFDRFEIQISSRFHRIMYHSNILMIPGKTNQRIIN